MKTAAFKRYSTALGLHEEPKLLAAGFNSYVIKIGQNVVKISRLSKPTLESLQLAQIMQAEHDSLSRYFGANMPRTFYALAAGFAKPCQSQVLTLQEFVNGLNIGDYLREPTAQAPIIVSFFERCSDMYEETGQIPDVANAQTGFNVFMNRNVVVDPIQHIPYLVDTNFGKIQRSKKLGPLWSKAIHWGVQRGLAELKQ